MEKEFDRIRALLAKFYEGDTDNEEEATLAEFFSRDLDLPEDLQADKAVFESMQSALDEIQAPAGLNAEIMAAIDRDIEKRRGASRRGSVNRRIWKLISAISAAAAVIVIVTLIPFTSDFQDDSLRDTQMASYTKADSARTIMEESSTDTREPVAAAMKAEEQDYSPNATKPVKTISRASVAQVSEDNPQNGETISEEELKALHEGLAMLAKAGQKIAYAKERISNTENTVNNSLEEISGILNR